jgi:hypothetical protein
LKSRGLTERNTSVLFGVELGGGFGHVRRLSPFIEQTIAWGYRPIVFVQNPAETRLILEDPRIELRAAPVPPAPPARRGPDAIACSFADILGRAGFDDPAWLTDAIRAWDATLDEIRPAAVVCEFSPFLCLSLWGSGLVGSGDLRSAAGLRDLVSCWLEAIGIRPAQ